MRVAIDSAGRIVVPKPLRDRLGLTGPSELEVIEDAGRIVLSPVPGTVELVEREGVLVAERSADVAPLDAETVRDLVEHQRR
ncbi:MAG: AbrB/MazE/SpoVT family DNA-binding domain-containing protein [Actinomycetota bacterium]|nr:AbrB/MazE/SpoVT family DNA-binding domain-containing protein [Actinomycetota bacterium]